MQLSLLSLATVFFLTSPRTAWAQHSDHARNEHAGVHLTTYTSYSEENNSRVRYEIEHLTDISRHFGATPSFGAGLALGVRGLLTEGAYGILAMTTFHLDFLRPVHAIVFAGLDLRVVPEVHSTGRIVLHMILERTTIAPVLIAVLNVSADGNLQGEISPGISVHLARRDHLSLLARVTSPVWNGRILAPTTEEERGWTIGVAVLHTHDFSL